MCSYELGGRFYLQSFKSVNVWILFHCWGSSLEGLELEELEWEGIEFDELEWDEFESEELESESSL